MYTTVSCTNVPLCHCAQSLSLSWVVSGGDTPLYLSQRCSRPSSMPRTGVHGPDIYQSGGGRRCTGCLAEECHVPAREKIEMEQRKEEGSVCNE